MKIGFRDAMAYFRDGSVSLGHKLLGLLAVLYVVSPIDLVPDFAPFIGWLDDVGVLALIAGYYLRQISQHRSRVIEARTVPPRELPLPDESEKARV